MTWLNADQQKPPVDTPVLAVIERENGRRSILRASWIAKFSVETDCDDYEGEPDYSEEKDRYYYPEGWYERNEYDEVNWAVSGRVTHWQPLPEFPQEEAE